MRKDLKKTLILTGVITLLPILIGIYYWDRLPDPMATHFGLNNQADGFSSKRFAVFGLPLILLLIEGICVFAISWDPKKRNISPKISSLTLWIVPVVSLLANITMYSYNLGYPVDFAMISGLVLGLVFILTGNYLPKARQNYTIGIRLPWTLANEENWNRTHRLAGYLWMAAGILMVIASLLRVISPAFLLAFALLTALIPIIYSWRLHAAHNL